MMSMDEAEAELDALYAHPAVVKAAEEIMAAEAAARAERKAAERRMREGEALLRQAAGLPPKEEPKPAFAPIETYDAAALRSKIIKAITVIVEGLLQAGFSVLAGAPKRGKSWLALSLAIAVATGGQFLGRRCVQGDVLYLDLESSEGRVKKRLSMLLPGAWPEHLHIAHRADLLGDNGKLMLQIEDWLDKHPNTRLIIIDTIGRVKGGGRRNENAYETDTRMYGALQRLSLDRSVATLGIHHMKKGVDDADDWFEKISGSMGLTGVCDTVMALTGKRDEKDCILKTASRDFETDGDMVLRLEGGTWVVVGADPQVYAADKAYRESGIVRGVLALMEAQPEWQGTATQLLDAITEVYQGRLETYSSNKFISEFDKVVAELYERDGVVCRRKLVRGRKVILLNRDAGAGL